MPYGIVGKENGANIDTCYHGDHQIVPYADSEPLSAKLLKDGTIKTYKGFPHDMPATQADAINAELLAFIKS